MAENDLQVTFKIEQGGKAITCLRCGKTSYNPHDVENRYCGNCHIFHMDKKLNG
jgi:ribosomal protein L37E